MNPVEHKPAPLKRLVAAGSLLALNLGAFGPFLIYSTNPGEFQTTFPSLLAMLLVAVGCVLAAVVGTGLILPEAQRRRYLLVVLLLGVMSYVHANLLVWDVGALDGSALDLAHGYRSWIDLALWAVVAVIGYRLRHALLRNCASICIGLLLLQLAGAVITAIRQPASLGLSQAFQEPPATLFKLSPEHNVIHIVLDAFQADVLPTLLSTRPKLAEKLAGFTYFPDTLTSSDITYLAMPAVLSGRDFTNEQPISGYWRSVFEGNNLYRFFADNGYDVDTSTPLWWNRAQSYQRSHYRIPTPYAERGELALTNALWLLDLSLFRHAPFFLKPATYRNETWLLSNLAPNPHQRFDHYAHTAFLSDFTARLTSSNPKPTYKSLHLLTPHAPLVAAADCQPAQQTLDYDRANFVRQATCAFEDVAGLLDRLRQLELYDASLIVIHGDHGAAFEFEMQRSDGSTGGSLTSGVGLSAAPLPLLLIKPVEAGGPLQTSNAPVQLSDIPATLAELAQLEQVFPGQSAFGGTSNAGRARRYYVGLPHRDDALANDYFDSYQSYLVNGSVYREADWQLGERRQGAQLQGLTLGNWGDPITFGSQGNSKPARFEGWSVTQQPGITWNRATSVALRFTLPPADRDIRLIADVKAFLVPRKHQQQRVLIRVNGQSLGQWLITDPDFKPQEIVIPQELLAGPGPTEFRFDYPDAAAPSAFSSSKDTRKLGVAFRSVRFVPD